MIPIFKKLGEKPSNSGVIVENRSQDTGNTAQNEEIQQCGQDLMNALFTGDPLAVGQALYNAARAADQEPHSEGPHTYEAQNQKAGQE